MSQLPESYEFIESYLRGELSSEEKELFEKRLAIDPAFNEDYQTQKMVNELILEKNLLELRRQVRADLDNKSYNWKKPAIIAGALLLGGSIYYLMSPSFKEAPETRLTTSPIVAQSADSSKGGTNTGNTRVGGSSTPPISSEASPKSTEAALENKHDTITQQVQEAKEWSTPSAGKAEKQAPIPEQHVAKVDTSRPCPRISFHTENSSSCKGKATGSIVILKDQISGGQPPYTFTIDQSFGSVAAFSELAAGNYTIKIQDKKGCISEKSIEIGEKSCVDYKDYSFNPTSENWKFPFFEDDNATLTISDRTGKIVYKTSIQNGQPSEWNGKASNGELLESGTYLYIAQSEKGEIKQGYIIILK